MEGIHFQTGLLGRFLLETNEEKSFIHSKISILEGHHRVLLALASLYVTQVSSLEKCEMGHPFRVIFSITYFFLILEFMDILCMYANFVSAMDFF